MNNRTENPIKRLIKGLVPEQDFFERSATEAHEQILLVVAEQMQVLVPGNSNMSDRIAAITELASAIEETFVLLEEYFDEKFDKFVQGYTNLQILIKCGATGYPADAGEQFYTDFFSQVIAELVDQIKLDFRNLAHSNLLTPILQKLLGVDAIGPKQAVAEEAAEQQASTPAPQEPAVEQSALSAKSIEMLARIDKIFIRKKGALPKMIATFLAKHPGESFTPRAIAEEIGREPAKVSGAFSELTGNLFLMESNELGLNGLKITQGGTKGKFTYTMTLVQAENKQEN